MRINSISKGLLPRGELSAMRRGATVISGEVVVVAATGVVIDVMVGKMYFCAIETDMRQNPLIFLK